MSKIFYKNFENLVKKIFNLPLTESSKIKTEITKFTENLNVKDLELFRRFPKKELKSFIKYECPVTNKLMIRNYKSSNVIQALKNLRFSLDVNESSVCSTCSLKKTCKFANKTPANKEATISDLLIVLNSYSAFVPISTQHSETTNSELKEEHENNPESVNENPQETNISEQEINEKKTIEKKDDISDLSVYDKKIEFKVWLAGTKITDTLFVILDDLIHNQGIDSKAFLNQLIENDAFNKINMIKVDDDDIDKDEVELKSNPKIKKFDDDNEEIEKDSKKSKTKQTNKKPKKEISEELDELSEDEIENSEEEISEEFKGKKFNDKFKKKNFGESYNNKQYEKKNYVQNDNYNDQNKNFRRKYENNNEDYNKRENYGNKNFQKKPYNKNFNNDNKENRRNYSNDRFNNNRRNDNENNEGGYNRRNSYSVGKRYGNQNQNENNYSENFNNKKFMRNSEKDFKQHERKEFNEDNRYNNNRKYEKKYNPKSSNLKEFDVVEKDDILLRKNKGGRGKIQTKNDIDDNFEFSETIKNDKK